MEQFFGEDDEEELFHTIDEESQEMGETFFFNRKSVPSQNRTHRRVFVEGSNGAFSNLKVPNGNFGASESENEKSAQKSSGFLIKKENSPSFFTASVNPNGNEKLTGRQQGLPPIGGSVEIENLDATNTAVVFSEGLPKTPTGVEEEKTAYLYALASVTFGWLFVPYLLGLYSLFLIKKADKIARKGKKRNLYLLKKGRNLVYISFGFSTALIFLVLTLPLIISFSVRVR